MPASLSHVPPVTCHSPIGQRAPLVFDSPHSGTWFPDDSALVLARQQLQKLEDPFVDALFATAPTFGATLVAAQFARACIDPNRAEDDIHAPALSGGWPGQSRPTQKALLGVGLVFMRTPDGEALYAEPPTAAVVRARIEQLYRPYHERLDAEIASLQRQYGHVWHVNCHSMPSRPGHLLSAVAPRRADFCIGDRHGTSCSPALTSLIAETLADQGYRVAVNEPYAGVELIRRHGQPLRGRHSVQLEINRDLYMDEQAHVRHEGFEILQRVLEHLVQTLAAASLGECSEAAE
ncbi:MAG: N-formylglutamate amidohydrolase [Pseudomonadota bacterium]